MKNSAFLRIAWFVIWGLLLVACQNKNPLILPTDTPLPTVTMAPIPSPTIAANSILGFQNFFSEIEALKSNQRQAIVNRYLARIQEAPLTSNNQAIFIWRGAATSIHLVGDMNNWDSENALELNRIDGTDLWYLVGEYEPDARLDYRFLIDGQQLELDPLNSNIVGSLNGPNSVLIMPQHPTLLNPGLEGNILPGSITSHTLNSEYLNQTRTFFVYQPAGQIVGKSLPLVVVNNGSDYLNLIDTPSVLDQLIADRRLQPMVVTFVPAIDSTQDYVLNDVYIRFLADELVPFVQELYGTAGDSASRVVVGAADGGRSAIYTVATRPDVFGNAASQSGIFSLEDISAIRQAVRLMEPSLQNNPEFRLLVGTYETNVETNAGRQDIFAANQRLASALVSTQVDVTIVDRPEGHSWGFWQWTLGPLLNDLLS